MLNDMWSEMPRSRKAGMVAIRFLVVGMLLVTSLLVAIEFSSDEAEAAQAVVTLEFDSPHQLIDCGPGDNCIAVFTGRVMLDPVMNPTYREGQLSRFDITLSASASDPTYLYSVMPPIFSIDWSPMWGRRFYPITLTVRAPMMAPADPEGVDINVTGTWISFPDFGLGSGTIPTQRVHVEARPYYEIMVSSDPVFVRRWPGGAQSYRIDIYNLGTYVDQVSIFPQPPAGWAAELSHPLVYVPAKSNTSVVITIHPEQSIHPWKQQVSEIVITFRSEQAWLRGEDVSTVYSLYLYEWGIATFAYFHWGCWAGLVMAFILTIAIAAALVFGKNDSMPISYEVYRNSKGKKRIRFHSNPNSKFKPKLKMKRGPRKKRAGRPAAGGAKFKPSEEGGAEGKTRRDRKKKKGFKIHLKRRPGARKKPGSS